MENARKHFRNAQSAFNPERKGRNLGERKKRIDYQRGWWNGLQGEGSILHKEGPKDPD